MREMREKTKKRDEILIRKGYEGVYICFHLLFPALLYYVSNLKFLNACHCYQ